MSRLADVLSAHGLKVSLREKVTGENLKRAVNPETLAIFLAKPHARAQQRHYLIVAYHPTKGALLVDPPFRTTAFDSEATNKILEETGGLTIFVQKPSATAGARMADQVRLTQETFDLGRFSPDGEKQVKFEIVNTGSDPVCLSTIATPCTCMRVTWKQVLLNKSESLDVSLHINLSRWPDRATEQNVVIGFPDGSERTIVIKGEKTPLESIRKIIADPAVVRVDVTSTNTVLPIAQGVTLQVPEGYKGKLICKSSASWIRTRIDDNSPTKLVLSMQPEPSAFSRTNDLEGSVRVNTNDGLSTDVRVVLYRTPFFSCSPSIVSGKRSSPIDQLISIAPTSKGKVLRGDSLRLAVDGLKANIVSTKDGTVAIQLTSTAKVASGVYSLECMLECNSGKRALAIIPIVIND